MGRIERVGRIEATFAVPLRLSMFLKRVESETLSKNIEGTITKWGIPKSVEAYERLIKAERRIVRGVYDEGTFRYSYHKGAGEEDERNIDALAFWHSEFPATANEFGNKLPERDEPVEFVMTTRFTALLLNRERMSLATPGYSRLVVRRGLVEVGLYLHGKALTSVADAIIAVEEQGGEEGRWLKPVANEIVECNLLSNG